MAEEYGGRHKYAWGYHYLQLFQHALKLNQRVCYYMCLFTKIDVILLVKQDFSPSDSLNFFCSDHGSVSQRSDKRSSTVCTRWGISSSFSHLQLLFLWTENIGYTDTCVGAACVQPGFKRPAAGPPQRAEEQAAEEKCVTAWLCQHGADKGDGEYVWDQTHDRLVLWWDGSNVFYN